MEIGGKLIDALWESLPLRERGLKYFQIYHTRIHLHVAPLAGAWIEMLANSIMASNIASLPLRERGLKFTPIEMVGGQQSRSPCGSVD